MTRERILREYLNSTNSDTEIRNSKRHEKREFREIVFEILSEFFLSFSARKFL